jgi:type IV pilus assembly protein PilO
MSKENSKIKEFSEKFAVLFEQIGKLTKVQRLLICLLTFALIGGVYYYFIFMPKHKELKKVKNLYESQVKTLATYKKRASEIIKCNPFYGNTVFISFKTFKPHSRWNNKICHTIKQH